MRQNGICIQEGTPVDEDIRYKQRFTNYQNALMHLNDAVELTKSRNLTSYIYDEKVIDEIIQAICDNYIDSFLELKETMERIK